MKREDLIKILEGEISLIDKMNLKEIALAEIEIFVKPNHVRKMLLDFLAGKITADELAKWSKFICLRPEYGSEFYLDDEKWNYHETMFNVIQRLSTPELDGDVTHESVKNYLSKLKIYYG